MEAGSAAKLEKFLQEAAFKYEVSMKNLVFKPGLSLTEFANIDFLKGILQLKVFTSVQQYVHKLFKDERLRQWLTFPVLFLGAMPNKIPALYTLMNYADIQGGTWYPQGGMYSVVKSYARVGAGIWRRIFLQ